MNSISLFSTFASPFPAKHLSSAAGARVLPSLVGGLHSRQRTRRFRVSNAVTTAERRSSASSPISLEKLSKFSATMEQLDFERDVCVPFRKYTPETVRNKVLESNGVVASLSSRGVEIVWTLGLYWSTFMYDYFVGRDQEVFPKRTRQLRNMLCDLGTSFIKAGHVRLTP